MSDTALATIQNGAPPITGEQLALIKRTVAKDATPEELELFFYDCRRHGVHPLDKLIHFTKRKGKYTPITSIDLMRSRAAETGEMAGNDDPLFTSEASAEGEEERLATATVYRITGSQRYPYTATARWSEYYPGDGDPGFMWRKMPHTMLGKCAEALALRKAFPKQLSGLYAREEMQQADAPEIVAPRAPQTSVTPEQLDRETMQAFPPGIEGEQEDPRPRFLTGDLTCPTCQRRVFKRKDGSGWFCWQQKGGCGSQWKSEPVTVDKETGEVQDDDRAFLLGSVINGLKGFTGEERAGLFKSYLAGKDPTTASTEALKKLYLFVGDAEAVRQWRKERAAA